MKKKTLTKKLTLNKERISALNYVEMNKIKGASVFLLCTESCSVFMACCDPTTKEDNNNDLEKGHG